MKKLFSYSLAVLLLAAGGVQAQQPMGPGGQMGPGGVIRGVVLDETAGTPISAASVAVYAPSDSSIVTGAMTDDAGRFRIEGLRPGNYYVRVSFIGYKSQVVDQVAVTPAALTADLGQLKLATAPVELAAVEATTERSAVVVTVDRTVYNAKDMASAAGGNATDVLRNVPAIEVSVDDKVSLRGNENVAIQINGRPAPMRGDALTNFLKQLPASAIDRVEVIPNPSAKFDPEGMGGIINIVLAQNASLGLSGGANLGFAPGGRYNASGNLGYQAGPLTLFGSYSFNHDKREGEGFTFRENRYDNPITYLDQQTSTDFGHVFNMLNTTAELRLGEKDVLSSGVMAHIRSGDVDNVNAYRMLDAGRTSFAEFDRISGVDMAGSMLDLNIAHRRTFVPQKHDLSTELRFSRSTDDRESLFTLQAAGEPDFREINEMDNQSTEVTIQSDYTKALNEAWKVETGYKGILREIDNDFVAKGFVGGEPQIDPAQSNAFIYNEDVHAVYGLLTRDFGKVDAQAGLRAERVNTNFDLTSTDDAYENEYSSLFPSASLMYSFNETRQMKASYSKRVQRPQTFFLNPFAMKEDPLNLFVGNPYLKPEYTHAFELNFSQYTSFGSVQVTPYYRRAEDIIRRFKTVDTNGVSTTTFQNAESSESFGADLTSSFRFGGRMSGFASFSAFRMQTDASNVEQGLGSDAYGWNARANATYKLTPSTDVSWFYMYRAPMEVEQGRMKGMFMSNVSVRQKLGSDKTSLTVRVMDPFDQMRFGFITEDATHWQETERRMNMRSIFLTLSHTFGKPPKMDPSRMQNQPQQAEPIDQGGIN